LVIERSKSAGKTSIRRDAVIPHPDRWTRRSCAQDLDLDDEHEDDRVTSPDPELAELDNTAGIVELALRMAWYDTDVPAPCPP
jgi:hypothetical protein